jgi:hypothetical protein
MYLNQLPRALDEPHAFALNIEVWIEAKKINVCAMAS